MTAITVNVNSSCYIENKSVGSCPSPHKFSKNNTSTQDPIIENTKQRVKTVIENYG